MCLIIASETGKHPDADLIAQALFDNHDGWGLMHLTNGKVTVDKGFELDGLTAAMDKVTSPYVLHFRWATAGKVNLDNCHPFRVQDGLYMAHNGVLQTPTPNKGYSDTWHFVQNVLKPLFKADPLSLDDPTFMTELETCIGKGNKLAFMDNWGRITIANRAMGLEHDGLWLSNGHSLPDPRDWAYDWAKSYKPKGKGGFLADTYEPPATSTACEFLDLQQCDYCENESHTLDYSMELEAWLCADCHGYYCESYDTEVRTA